MFDYEDLEKYFDEIIKSDSVNFHLEFKKTYKENGLVKQRTFSEELELRPISNIQDLFETDDVEVIDFFPKNIFQKLFSFRKKPLYHTGESNQFLLMSEKTQKVFKTNCVVYELLEDNKVIIGTRSRLIYHIDGDKFWAYTDSNKFKTILIK